MECNREDDSESDSEDTDEEKDNEQQGNTDENDRYDSPSESNEPNPSYQLISDAFIEEQSIMSQAREGSDGTKSTDRDGSSPTDEALNPNETEEKENKHKEDHTMQLVIDKLRCSSCTDPLSGSW